MSVEIIAEIGQNHNGDMAVAKDLIAAAKEAGADVAKFQVFDAHALFPQVGNEWFDYNCKAELSRDQVELLADECDRLGIEFMASVFDQERLGWVDEIAGVCRHKIASRSIQDMALIDAIIRTGKSVIISLGMWDRVELPDFVSTGSIDYLYCISDYPTALENLQIQIIDFNEYSGFSDHTIGLTAAKTAIVRGARLIEKHFTLDVDMYGPDHRGSMTPEDLKSLVEFKDDFEKIGRNIAPFRDK